MNVSRLTSTAIAFVAFASALSAQINGYASADASTSANWNSADGSKKWTVNSGSTYGGAGAGVTYHTNGYTIRAGRIGTLSTTTEGTSSFNGDQLILDKYSVSSGLTSNANAGGSLLFELASSPLGPRLNPTGYTWGSYTANILTASGSTATISARNGVTTLNGTLELDGNTTFNTASAGTDFYFHVVSQVTGTGNITFSGGSAGGGLANGYITWAFDDLSGWQGSSISVYNKHTLSFTGDADFYTTNPNASIVFSTGGSAGFLDLSADVSFASGKFSYLTGTGGSVTNYLADGIYDASDLNALVISWGGSSTQPFASGSGMLYIGSSFAAVPEPSTCAALAGLAALAGAFIVRRRRRA